MSDSPLGPGWWQASDLKWYPPESAQPTPPPPATSWGQDASGPWGGGPSPQAWPAPQQQFSPPPQRRRRRSGAGAIVKGSLVVGVAVAAVVGIASQAGRDDTGTVDEAGSLDVQELQVGDCFDMPALAIDTAEVTEVSEIQAIPCADAHGAEVYYAHASEEPADTPYPGDQAMEDRAAFICGAQFETFVGRPWEQSALYFGILFPTLETWDRGDRIVNCYVSRSDMAPLTGSVKGLGL